MKDNIWRGKCVFNNNRRCVVQKKKRKKHGANIKLETALPQAAIVISPGKVLRSNDYAFPVWTLKGSQSLGS